MDNYLEQLINNFENIKSVTELSIKHIGSNLEHFDNLKDAINYITISDYNKDIFALIELKRYISYAYPNDRVVLEDTFRILESYKDNKTYHMSDTLKKEILQNPKVISYINFLREKSSGYVKSTKSLEFLLRKMNSLNTILEYLKNIKETEYIDNFDLLDDFIFKDVKIDLKDKFEMYKLFNLYTINAGNKKLESVPNKEVILEDIKKYNLDKEDLKNLFNEYGYNLDLLDEELVNNILLYGNYNDIKDIFEFYKSINIHFDEKNKNNYRFFILLYKSDSNLINTIKEYCDKYKLNLRDLLLKNTSCFAHISKVINKDLLVEKLNLDLNGSYENFISNIDVLNKYGYNIYDAYHTCKSIFTISNDRLVKNIESLKLYGIDLNTKRGQISLSGLMSCDILLTIDKFIELGEMDYLINNTSRLMLSPDDTIFYRLYQVKKNNREDKVHYIEYRTDYNNKGICYKGFITKDNLARDNGLVTSKDKVSKLNIYKPELFIDNPISKITEFNDNEFDNKIFDISIVKRLEEHYKFNNTCYVIGDMTYSRYKFLRIFNKLYKYENIDLDDLVMYALTYNTLLTYEEYENTKELVFNRKRGRSNE